MEKLPLPSKIAFSQAGDHESLVTIEPCYPGYGTTLGNAYRRVLLSSLPGSAVTAVKIDGVTHEFSTLPNVKEDIVELILNLKGLRLRSFSDEPVTVKLHAEGEKEVRGKDLTLPSQVEVANPQHHIATLTDKNAELLMELTVTRGRGYVPVEQRADEKPELGMIAIDAIFTPVRNVNYRTENVRVGQMTNYDRLLLTIRTDGSVTPEDAFAQASDILLDHFTFLKGGIPAVAEKPAKRSKKTAAEPTDAPTEEKKPDSEDAGDEKTEKKSKRKT